MFLGLHAEYTIFFCPILTKFEFSLQIFYLSPQYQISRKSVQWKPCWTDGRSDMEKVIGASCDYANAHQYVDC